MPSCQHSDLTVDAKSKPTKINSVSQGDYTTLISAISAPQLHVFRYNGLLDSKGVFLWRLKRQFIKRRLMADLDRNQFPRCLSTLAPPPVKPRRAYDAGYACRAWPKYADERLQFTRGLCADDEPEAWLRNDHRVLICGLSWGCRMSGGLRKACTQSRKSGAVYL